MHTIAIASRKGGVGKTTVAVNLAAALALEGHRVLVIDMDSQGNATRILLDEKPSTESPTTAHVLAGSAGLADIVHSSNRPGVDIAPASKELTHALMAIVGKMGRETILKRALMKLDGYNIAIIDTAPEQQLGTANSLVAATHVVMPFVPEAAALEGMETTNEAIAEVLAAGLGSATLLGCVQIAYDRRLSVTEETRQQVLASYGPLLFNTTVRANSNFLLCTAWHRVIFDIEKETRPPRRGCEDFQALATEVAQRLALRAPSQVAA
jgi:chromosome partitioning protein